jgi:hypothetical protein
VQGLGGGGGEGGGGGGGGGGGALQGKFGRYRCAAEIAKTPHCIYIASK